MSLENLNLDIHSFLQTATYITLGLFALLFLRGLQYIRSSGQLPYFRLRREQLIRGWRILGISVFLGLLAVLINVFGEPIAYSYYPVTSTLAPTQTETLTPTITPTPTITLTPSMTPTLEFTYTPTPTSTPHIPLAISAQFESEVTPNVEIVFSPLIIAKGYDEDFLPILPASVFQNPIRHLYAIFSYDGMAEGVQWTALWYRQGELLYFETKLWDGTTGGFGFTDREAPPEDWLPGTYVVQIFVGLQWVAAGTFILEGQSPTSLPVSMTPVTPTFTATPSPSVSPTATAGN